MATGWISNLKVLELQYYNYIIASIYLIIASFAVTYKSKLWRNEIAAKKRVMRGKNTTKADIHFHLATSRWICPFHFHFQYDKRGKDTKIFLLYYFQVNLTLDITFTVNCIHCHCQWNVGREKAEWVANWSNHSRGGDHSIFNMLLTMFWSGILSHDEN